MREESWEDTTGVALSLTQTSIPPTHPPTHPPTLTLFPTLASPTHHHHHHRQHHHHPTSTYVCTQALFEIVGSLVVVYWR